MNRKVLFVLKLLVGAYLVFVGVTLLHTILDVRPGNQEIMCGIASVFILVGMGYMIGLLVSAIKRSIKARNVTRPEGTDPIFKARPLRDQSIFRTAAMPLLSEDKEQIPAGARPVKERKKSTPVSRISSSTVTMQKVGPDTMIGENDKKET